MKKIFTLCVLLLSAFSCKYDDSELWDELNGLANRVARLEELCNETNTNISSLETAIRALEKNDYIINVAPVNENSIVIGYTITFAKSGTITIYHGKDGINGEAPKIGVKKNTDGIYYWTINGEWLLDDTGKKIKAEGQDGKDGVNGQDGITPQFKIQDEYWYISYDNGKTWKKLDKAKGDDGETPDVDIKKASDGIYYWTINGEWLLDDTGKKIKVEGQDGVDGQDGQDGVDGQDGITPQFKIQDEYWYISYDNGKTWNKLDKAKGDDGKDGTSIEVTEDSQYVYLTFSDGTVLVFPKASEEESVPVVTTGENPSVYENYAIVTGKVENVKSDVTVGIIYDTNMDLSENNGKQETKTASGIFAITLKDLDSGTTYYYRAFALVDGKYYFGNIENFKTQNSTIGVSNGFKWVDLGLTSGTKWGETNVGASKKHNRGTLYAWGAKSSQVTFNWSDYVYANGSSMYDIGANISGTSYDVATYKQGSTWRMPTKTEMEELVKECTRTWTQVENVNGMLFTGPNGNSIFLPAAGQDDYDWKNNYGCYWTGTRTSSLYHACYLYFADDYCVIKENTSVNIAGGERCNGYSIRPVLFEK